MKLQTVLTFPLKVLYHLLIDSAYQERIAYGSFGVDGYRVNKSRLWIPIFGGGLVARNSSSIVSAGGDGGGRIKNIGEDDQLAGGGGGALSIGISSQIGNFQVSPFVLVGGEGGGIAQIRHEAVVNKSITKADIHDSNGGGGLMNGAGIRITYRIGRAYGVLIGVQFGLRGVLIGAIRLPRPFIQAIVGFGKFDTVL
ncbi:MAG: hypothetical protein MUE54_12435 [Anaerolineae bacterium]|nr:hypothetical protein [Anaerolineae bacterium]